MKHTDKSRVLCALMSALMVASCFASFAFIQAPEQNSKTQLELVSIKAVDVQTSATGVRNYSAIVDTQRAYQVNDVVILATTMSVKNTAKDEYKNLASIKDTNIEVVVGSPNIDLSYSKRSSPVVISDMYSGYNDEAIANIAMPQMAQNSNTQGVLDISGVVEYDKAKNELKFVIQGYESNKTQTVEYKNTAATLKNGKINIPALRAKDGKETMKIGNQEYSLDYSAPSSLDYTVLLTGVTKENIGPKAKGEFYAKIQLGGAEVFKHHQTYYVKNQQVTFEKPTGTEFVDFVKVEVQKLSLKDSHNVYRYNVPASGITDDIDIVYLGEDSLNQNKILAKVNPAKFDNNTPQNGTDPQTAGSVKKAKALNGTEREVEVPATSVVFTNDKSYFAPYFYNGVTSIAKDDSQVSGEVMISEIELIKDTRETKVRQKYVTSFLGKIAYNKVLSASEALRAVKMNITGKNKLGTNVVAVHESYNSANVDATYSIAVNNAKNLIVVLTPKNGNEVSAVDWDVEVLADTVIGGSGGYALKTKATPEYNEADVKEFVTGFYNKGDLSILEKNSEFEVLDKHGVKVDKSQYTIKPTSSHGKTTAITLIPKQVAKVITDPITGRPKTVLEDPLWSREEFKLRVFHIVPSGGMETVTPIDAEAVVKLSEVVSQNGIVAYAITDSDDKPLISVATEATYFSGDHGYAIAMFDNTGTKAERVFRSNDGNLTYASGKGYVENSTTILKALKFFALDTSFTTTYKVQDEDFIKKALKVEFSENVVGNFKYGVISVVDDGVSEAIEEQEIVPTDETQEAPLTQEVAEETTQEDATAFEKSEPIPQTGDASANAAAALTVSATISALALIFVFKKTKVDSK